MTMAEGSNRRNAQARVAQRRKARHYLVQALYQWQMSGNSAAEVESQFVEDNDFVAADETYFREVFGQSTATAEELDRLIAPCLDRELDELDPVERSLLRMASCELLNRVDVPYKVVISEAVSLAKKFGASDSFKYINGVLDRLATELRTAETAR